jgi:DNA-directed RNA polymerase specialized sigma subunit
MNTNEIRFYLHNYEKLKNEIQALSDSLKEYRLMDGIKAKIITNMPICHSGESMVESIVVNRLDYVTGLEDEIDSKMRILNAINGVYFYLKEPARTIIEMRYFLQRKSEDVRKIKYNWQEIADEVNYTEIYCKKIDGRVILKIQNKLMK